MRLSSHDPLQSSADHLWMTVGLEKDLHGNSRPIRALLVAAEIHDTIAPCRQLLKRLVALQARAHAQIRTSLSTVYISIDRLFTSIMLVFKPDSSHGQAGGAIRWRELEKESQRNVKR